jgi:hypothetical protein
VTEPAPVRRILAPPAARPDDERIRICLASRVLLWGGPDAFEQLIEALVEAMEGIGIDCAGAGERA